MIKLYRIGTCAFGEVYSGSVEPGYQSNLNILLFTILFTLFQ